MSDRWIDPKDHGRPDPGYPLHWPSVNPHCVYVCLGCGTMDDDGATRCACDREDPFPSVSVADLLDERRALSSGLARALRR
jgi:hypothetical protein